MHNYALQYLENQSNYSYVSACDAKAKQKKNHVVPHCRLNDASIPALEWAQLGAFKGHNVIIVLFTSLYWNNLIINMLTLKCKYVHSNTFGCCTLVVDEEIAPLLCKALWVSRKALYKCNKLLLIIIIIII